MIHTYLDTKIPDGGLLPAGTPQLVFCAYIDKGPGFSEKVQWLFGPSIGGKLVALWIESDWVENPDFALSPVAWVEMKEKLAEPAWANLLRAYWEAERKHNLWDEPNFSEIINSRNSLMRLREVQELADSIWPPDEKDR